MKTGIYKRQQRVSLQAVAFLLVKVWLFSVACLAALAGAKQSIPWSFQPIQEKSHETVDAFIDAGLKKIGSIPNPRVDRFTLIRRATFDLTGLPPTPEEVLAFVNDPAPDAYDKLLDRLLASHHYGERWGRYWLDLARYADTNGADENMAYPNAWRYRDYVIRSFNQDKPYDQFIREQLAGDLLPATSDRSLLADRLTATGFLVLGPKMLAEQDKEKLLMDVVDEQIDVISRTFMGISVACARCHDHKFDPVTQEDYYALAGIFRSTMSMANTNHVSRWTERVLPHPGNFEIQAKYDARVEELETEISTLKRAAGSEETKKRIKELEKNLRTLKQKGPDLPKAMSVKDGDIRDLPVHLRGNHLTPTQSMVPRDQFNILYHAVKTPAIEQNSSGRLALAEWLCDSEHPLTARVMVNRIWKGHFGKGLVDTPSNFGNRGSLPSHPDLLDWLARRFIQNHWSIKAMHRLIMKSEAYQRSADNDSKRFSLDPDNQYLWRQNRRRLEVEPIRDALLMVGGLLRTAVGDALTSDIKGTDSYYRGKDDVFQTPVRSVYLPVLRSRVFDMFATFDFPDASAHLEKRSETVMPQQALFYMNGQLTDQVAESLANRLYQSRRSDPASLLESIYLTLFSRYPKAAEYEMATKFFKEIQIESGETIQRESWQRWIRILLSSNEFSYVD